MAALNSSLVRVNRRNPCPVCGKPNWCSVTDDGAMVICMRVAAGSICKSKNGGYIHILKEREYQPLQQIYRKPEPTPVAPIERRDAVYNALLDLLPLAHRHTEDLARRGLSDLTIARNGYASLPDRFNQVLEASNALARSHDLANVPGFFIDRQGRRRFSGIRRGFLIPVRDAQGRIQGCQIRCDEGDPRYLWFSSAGELDGASSGAPIHFARPWRVDATGEAIVTEGALKADVIAERLDCCVVGVPGISSFPINFGSWLTFKLPPLKRVLVAYDAEWRDPNKQRVGVELVRMLESLTEAELESIPLDWEGAKGLDDLLVKETRR